MHHLRRVFGVPRTDHGEGVSNQAAGAGTTRPVAGSWFRFDAVGFTALDPTALRNTVVAVHLGQ
jgi:hypothetical protein